ncbi:hypothetical protein SESBI_27797 [Sesbania bispinosa]|nr:hypothetical protein SESBI_27797 [Sesbania bispinosa]
MEKGDRSPVNSQLEAHPANPFAEAYPSSLGNNSALSSSQNPFFLPSAATNTTHEGATESEKVGLHQPFSTIQQDNGTMTNNSLSTYPGGSVAEMHHSSRDEMLGIDSSLAPSTYESSPGNPFQVPTSTTSGTPVGVAGSQKVVEYHDHGPEWHQTLPVKDQEDWRMPSYETKTHDLANTHGSPQLDPLFTHEPAQNQHLDDATGKKLGSSMPPFSPASESSPQDPMHNSVNASSNSQAGTNAPPKLGKDPKLASESSDDDIPVSSMPKHGQQSRDVAGKYSAAAVVVPERNNGSEIQNPPLQVMRRPEDPAPSSKYRIPSHVFSRDKSGTQWSTASNESLFSIQMGNMSFSNDTSWLSKSGSRVTEEKAAETMREVIMETSITTEKEKPSKRDSTVADRATPCNKLSTSNSHSHHSDGSTTSFAFKVLTDGENTPSKGVEDKLKQQKQSGKKTLEETSNAAQTPKPTPNASQKKWLSCFTCC